MKPILDQIDFEQRCLTAAHQELKSQKAKLQQAMTLIKYYGIALNNFREYGEARINSLDHHFNYEQYNAAFDQKESAEKWIAREEEEIFLISAKIDELMKKKFTDSKAAETNWNFTRKYQEGVQSELFSQYHTIS